MTLGATTLDIEPGSPWENGYVPQRVKASRDVSRQPDVPDVGERLDHVETPEPVGNQECLTLPRAATVRGSSRPEARVSRDEPRARDREL